MFLLLMVDMADMHKVGQALDTSKEAEQTDLVSNELVNLANRLNELAVRFKR